LTETISEASGVSTINDNTNHHWVNNVIFIKHGQGVYFLSLDCTPQLYTATKQPMILLLCSAQPSDKNISYHVHSKTDTCKSLTDETQKKVERRKMRTRTKQNRACHG
jgi:hypothetical protein